jgi:hypothetical protein
MNQAGVEMFVCNDCLDDFPALYHKLKGLYDIPDLNSRQFVVYERIFLLADDVSKGLSHMDTPLSHVLQDVRLYNQRAQFYAGC